MVAWFKKSIIILTLVLFLSSCSSSKTQVSEHQIKACEKIRLYVDSVKADERADDLYADAYVIILREALNEAELEQKISKTKFTREVISYWWGGVGGIRSDIGFTLGFQRDGLYIWKRIYSKYCK